MANSGCPEANRRLVEIFGDEHSRDAYRRHTFRKLALAMGEAAFWDHHKVEAEFNRVEADFLPDEPAPVDRLLAESAAFAYAHRNIALGYAGEIQAAIKADSPRYDSRALRDQTLNASRANLDFLRWVKQFESIPHRDARLERLQIENENARARGRLLQEQLRRLKESPIPGARKAKPDDDPHSWRRAAYEDPKAWGFDTYEDYVASLDEETRQEELAFLARGDKFRGFWANPEVFFYNRFPTLFPERHQNESGSVTPNDPSNSSDPSDSPCVTRHASCVTPNDPTDPTDLSDSPCVTRHASCVTPNDPSNSSDPSDSPCVTRHASRVAPNDPSNLSDLSHKSHPDSPEPCPPNPAPNHVYYVSEKPVKHLSVEPEEDRQDGAHHPRCVTRSASRVMPQDLPGPDPKCVTRSASRVMPQDFPDPHQQPDTQSRSTVYRPMRAIRELLDEANGIKPQKSRRTYRRFYSHVGLRELDRAFMLETRRARLRSRHVPKPKGQGRANPAPTGGKAEGDHTRGRAAELHNDVLEAS